MRSLLVFASLCFLTPTTNAAPILASGSFGTSEYVVIGDTSLNWTQANSAAQNLGAGWHLVAITSATEQAYLVSLLDAAGIGSGQLWAGGLQSPNSNIANANWTWSNGETWSYTAWAHDGNAQEPNDAFGAGSEGYLTLDNRWARDWTWNDETVGSRDRLGFVAERTAVPEPASMLVFGALAAGAGVFAYRRRNPDR